jgi:hypothetical protein
LSAFNKLWSGLQLLCLLLCYLQECLHLLLGSSSQKLLAVVVQLLQLRQREGVLVFLSLDGTAVGGTGGGGTGESSTGGSSTRCDIKATGLYIRGSTRSVDIR